MSRTRSEGVVAGGALRRELVLVASSARESLVLVNEAHVRESFITTSTREAGVVEVHALVCDVLQVATEHMRGCA